MCKRKIMSSLWVCGIVGCNKYIPEYLEVDENELNIFITKNKGDPSANLVPKMESTENLDDLDRKEFYMPLDIKSNDDEYRVYYIPSDINHHCFCERKNGRRLYCVKKRDNKFQTIRKWIDETVI